jgi:hypothetical protein
MKSALLNRLGYPKLGYPKLTEADRAHIKRWLAEVDDPVWEQIAADADAHDELAPFVDAPYSVFIGSALRLRHYVETKLDKPSLLKKRERQRSEQKFADWNSLANSMDEVVQRYRGFERNFPPPPPPAQRESELLLAWLAREAQKVRREAQRVLEPASDYFDLGPIRVRVSRQSGGKRKRPYSRELGVFMQSTVNSMYRICGKPRYHAVATITNIAFPAAKVTADDVRSACRPTTRAGRRRKSGAPG